LKWRLICPEKKKERNHKINIFFRIVFWAGDLNFRIETLERDDIIKIALARGPYDQLLKHDQVNMNSFVTRFGKF